MAVINYSLEAVIETAAVLATLNPVLLDGQLGKESDSGKFKVGNGVLAWNSIDYHTTNNNMSVFMGPSSDPNNLIVSSPLDGGVALTKDLLDYSSVVDQALAGTIDLSSRASFASEQRHKTAALILGSMVKRLISALGSNFQTMTTEAGYTGTTIQTSIADLQTAVSTLQSGSSAVVNDAVTNTSNTWSSSKVASEILNAVQALRTQLVGTAGEALDTIYELGEALANNTSYVTTISDELGKTIKYTLQSLTVEQQAQARTNISAANESEVLKIISQTLSVAQKTQARTNIGAVEDANLVKSVAQTLTAVEKLQARTNIGAPDVASVQMKNAGIVTGANATATSESDRVANSVQILSHSRYGGSVDNGRGFLLGAATTAAGNGLLKMYKAIGDGVYESNPCFTVGGDDAYARVYNDKVLTEANTATISNKIFVRPREQRTSLADAVNSIDLRTCGSFVSMRPNGNITLVTDVLNTYADEGRSIALYIYPTATVTFAANDAVKWPNNTIPTLTANKVTVVHFSLIHFPNAIAFWMAQPGSVYL